MTQKKEPKKIALYMEDKCPRCGGDADDNWFDRSFCPCENDDMYGGIMHTRCTNCGYPLDGCKFEQENTPPDST